VGNAERYLKSPDAMAALFADRPDAAAAARALADRLEYTMADLGYRFPASLAGGRNHAVVSQEDRAGGRGDRYRPYHDARARRSRASWISSRGWIWSATS
jgi:error-prone DNA polymerase